jgi:hypothetical protein
VTGMDEPHERDGWYVGHEDECYDTGDCCCSGVQIQCSCEPLPEQAVDRAAECSR